MSVHSTIAIFPLRITVMQYGESLTSALSESTQISTSKQTFFYWQTFSRISVATATEHMVLIQFMTTRHRNSHGTPCSNTRESSCNCSPTLTWTWNVASEAASVNAAITIPVQIIHISLTTIRLRIRHTSCITT